MGIFDTLFFKAWNLWLMRYRIEDSDILQPNWLDDVNFYSLPQWLDLLPQWQDSLLHWQYFIAGFVTSIIWGRT